MGGKRLHEENILKKSQDNGINEEFFHLTTQEELVIAR
jgi:hypothetical protein